MQATAQPGRDAVHEKKAGQKHLNFSKGGNYSVLGGGKSRLVLYWSMVEASLRIYRGRWSYTNKVQPRETLVR